MVRSISHASRHSGGVRSPAQDGAAAAAQSAQERERSTAGAGQQPGGLARRRKRARDAAAAPQPGLPQAPSADGRLVVVSNRMVDPSKAAAGGVAVALADTMHGNEGLWMGWSGEIGGRPGTPKIRTQPFGKSTLVGMDLSRAQFNHYYSGFYNSVLWPVMQNSAQWADLKPSHYGVYRQVNRIFASQLAPLLRDDDVLWIHDCHLIPLAEELRKLGCRQRIGFFNHSPFPAPDVFKAIPQHGELMQSLFSYDLVGMQIPRDVDHLREYVRAEHAQEAEDGKTLQAYGRRIQLEHFPIGIDFQNLMELKPNADSDWILDKVRAEKDQGRMLMVGVERLDYAKGIPDRLSALGDLLERRADLRGKVTFVQIGAPSRQNVQAYADLARNTRKLVDAINQRYGTESWQPILYIDQSVQRNALPDIYRMSRVGVVTSVADGMNLVSKEYVATQDAKDPGVLVLSEGAGAAYQLKDAIQVPPSNLQAITRAYEQALSMGPEERRERHARLLDNVRTEDLTRWRSNYLSALRSVPTAAPGDGSSVSGRDAKRGRSSA
ncbi:trehalose-6-phosphate synthase [Acidovorax sp. PRC11]|uniref:alpha,alpha-trehalose-phosphate synthase (UDP-forming) n=4 Tax=Bacteria TaxID=2 RepID=UPI00288116F0|nr:trehalose-6-phosphate synthase [Acidovorax sp. PRC11]MDT0140004.1 trehalose-6-phosphate synthase [Acidovorax sp. PRC11]